MKRNLIVIIIIVLVGIAAFLGLVSALIDIRFKPAIYAKNNIKTDPSMVDEQVALILGARVYSNGDLAPIFRDRVDSGVELYNSGSVQKLLVSGDNGTEYYDEVNAAKDRLLEAGIPPEDIFLDHAGFDTYDSIYRAKDIFEVDSVVIVTQEFHLPRALWIAGELGLDATGYKADMREYSGIKRAENREKLANVKAYINLKTNAKPKFLGEKISITGDGRDSWD